jgi:hypothetical protein
VPTELDGLYPTKLVDDLVHGVGGPREAAKAWRDIDAGERARRRKQPAPIDHRCHNHRACLFHDRSFRWVLGSPANFASVVPSGSGQFVERIVLFARFSAIMAIVENLATLARQWATSTANCD